MASFQNFESSYEFIRPSVPFLREETRPSINEIICNHLCREGMLDTAEQLIKVCANKNEIILYSK